MRKMQTHNLQDYFESIASKEGMEQEIVRIKGNLYSTKVQTFNDFVTFLNLIKHDEMKFYTVPSSTKIKEEHASSTSSDDFEVITYRSTRTGFHLGGENVGQQDFKPAQN
nr:bulb-type lectin domain-containing protein [Tanacetum cinerariifolium]